MSRRVTSLQVVTGKGGVGKSTFAAALAIAEARAGRRVLAIEMGAPAGLSKLLGVLPTAHGVPVAASAGLEVAYYDGEAALSEYLLQRVPARGLLRRLFAHPLYRAFVDAGPGVRELMAIGKVRDEQLGLSSGGPQWDVLVVDAGASGHALQLLGMPAATAATFRTGLAHREATRVASSLADPATSAVHVVALPEEMPLEEAAQVIARLRGDLGLPLGRLVINQCRPLLPQGAAAALHSLRAEAHPSPAQKQLAVAAARALGWVQLQEEGISHLEQSSGLKALRLPRLAAEAFGRAQVEQLAGELAVERP